MEFKKIDQGDQNISSVEIYEQYATPEQKKAVDELVQQLKEFLYKVKLEENGKVNRKLFNRFQGILEVLRERATLHGINKNDEEIILNVLKEARNNMQEGFKEK